MLSRDNRHRDQQSKRKIALMLTCFTEGQEGTQRKEGKEHRGFSPTQENGNRVCSKQRKVGAKKKDAAARSKEVREKRSEESAVARSVRRCALQCEVRTLLARCFPLSLASKVSSGAHIGKCTPTSYKKSRLHDLLLCCFLRSMGDGHAGSSATRVTGVHAVVICGCCPL